MKRHLFIAGCLSLMWPASCLLALSPAQSTYSHSIAPQAPLLEQLPDDPPPIYKPRFSLKNLFQKKEKPVPEETIVEVGPQGGHATQGQLVRLTEPICLSNQAQLSAGMALASVQLTPPQLHLMQAGHQTTLPLQHVPGLAAPTTEAGTIQAIPSETAVSLPTVRFQNGQFHVQQGTQAWVSSSVSCSETSVW